MPYDFDRLERHWQSFWDEHKTFRADIVPGKPKYYVLDMFPYPSGDGLHVGHPEGYTATDIVARHKRMTGHNVLHPMGWDAFGLPAERYAIKTGTHPARRTAECIANFKRQLGRLGFSYDWDREIDTTDPKYFKWTQWIFLQIWNSWFDPETRTARPIESLPIPAEVEAEGQVAVASFRDEHRLAYLNEAPVNWCPELRVVLANEEVAEHVDAGREVVRVPMRQWMLRITKYAERLITDLEGLDWPTSVLEMQRNWIGRSDGAEVEFSLEGAQDGGITVFTTRPDTLFGATYMVLAPEHPLVAIITTDDQRAKVDAYVDATSRRTERDRQTAAADAEKTGAFTGAHAINPVNGAKVPVWISDYVLMGYGTGAIMAVPGHDERDHAFAKTFDLPIVRVVDGGEGDIQDAAFVGAGVAVNSGLLDGKGTDDAKQAMIAHLEGEGTGRRRVTYKLRDWLFSRQRYWGEPFPLVHQPDGRVTAVDEADLPVALPEMEDFNPSETGEPPLAKAEGWRDVGGGALRETNTMPQWAGSCWYYLRYLDPTNGDAPFSKEAEQYWMPVDLYVGGAEHAVLHLLYARFWHKVLYDLGHVSTVEPFGRLVNQGMVLGATYFPKDKRRDEDGKPVVFLPGDVEADPPGSDTFVHKETREPLTVQWDKMSKSRGNVVNPDVVIAEYGADTMRLYEMFMGPLEHSAPWQPEGVVGCHKFLQRAYRLFFADAHPDEAGGEVTESVRPVADGDGTDRQRRLLAQMIDQVSDRTDRMSFNTAISAMMVFVRDVEKGGERLTRGAAEDFAKVLSPYAPHLAEEIWQRALGREGSVALQTWPTADADFLHDETWTLVLQVKGKKRGELELGSDVDAGDRETIEKLALAHEGIAKFLVDEAGNAKAPRRVIYVPGKLVNVVP